MYSGKSQNAAVDSPCFVATVHHRGTEIQTLKKLDCLPYDVLLQIAELLYAGEVKHKGCSKFRATWVLSRVNRRLRELVLPLLYREVTLKPQEDLTAAITRFLPGSKVNELSTSVRSLSMWRVLSSSSNFLALRLVEGSFPFTSLTEFDFPDSVLDDTTIEALGKCTQLHSLAVACSKEWPKPMLEQLPNLTELRLQVLSLHILANPTSFRRITYNSITTLSLRDPFPELCDDFTETCRFPNLVVFLIQGRLLFIDRLFQFIHDHPTLLEVSVNMYSGRTRVEALLKLIDGTGTWITTEDPEATYLNPRLCNISDDFSDPTPDNLFPPNIVPGVLVFCKSFSFTRSHIQPNSTRWHSPFGSPYPRYKLVSLAMTDLSQSLVTPNGRDEEDVAGIFKALEYVSQVAPDLEEFRLHVRDRTHTSPFMEWTDVLKEKVLGNSRELRKLALYWDIRGGHSFHPCWGISSSLTFRSSGECYIPLLDDATPPIEPTRDKVKPTNISDLHHSNVNLNKIIAGVRDVFQLPDEEELDIFDDTLLIRAWDARNRDYADETARKFAAACPQLTTFDWYFLSERPYLTLDINDHWVVSWSYKFQRRSDNPQLITPSSTFRWTGCLLGDPAPLYPLVGQELKRAVKLGGRAWAPFLHY